MSLWVILGILALIVVAVVLMYNGLITLRNRVDEAWSDITVQLKRRYDLIPNLVSTVQGYAKHESQVFQNVTEARTSAMGAQGVAETAKADNAFSSTLKSLFAVAENYPDLKANESFQQLQAELVDTEDKIQASRRFYNGGVRDYNTKLQSFPTNTLAGMFHFSAREFFELDDAQQAAASEPVKVDFNN